MESNKILKGDHSNKTLSCGVVCYVVQGGSYFKVWIQMKAPRSKLGAVFYALKQGQESFELLSLWMKSFSGPDYVHESHCTLFLMKHRPVLAVSR